MILIWKSTSIQSRISITPNSIVITSKILKIKTQNKRSNFKEMAFNLSILSLISKVTSTTFVQMNGADYLSEFKKIFNKNTKITVSLIMELIICPIYLAF